VGSQELPGARDSVEGHFRPRYNIVLIRNHRENVRSYPDMIRVNFTQNIQRHVSCPPTHVAGETVREVLDAVFAMNARARGYVLDDQGALRTHMQIFINGDQIHDREQLSDPVPSDCEVYVFQALSGG
jgi:molybdopterin synthase sulfur carrier subunit